MPAGGTTLRSTADYHETARSSSGRHHHHQHHHHRLSGPSSYVFAPSWMLRNGKKPPNNDQLAFTSFSGGNNTPQMSFSSRKSDYARPTVSTLRSSNSSPYPSSWDEEEEEEQQNNDKPDASEFPTLTSDDTINKRNEGRSAWSNPHLIKEKVLSPTRIDQVSQLDTGPSLEDIEFERLKALVPKQRTATRKIGNRLSSASPSPSSSSSSSHHHHHRSSHPHPHQQQQQHSQPHPHHRTSKSSSTHIRATTTNTTHKAHFVKKDHPAIVKISTSNNATITTTTTTKRVSGDSGTSTSTSTSSSSSSSSSSSGGMQHDTAQQTLSDPPPPTPLTTSTTPPGHLWVDEREKQHFLSWLYTWTCQPGIEWRKDAHALHHHGEYSYFGPLGTKSDASLFYQGNILVHSPWYNYS